MYTAILFSLSICLGVSTAQDNCVCLEGESYNIRNEACGFIIASGFMGECYENMAEIEDCILNGQEYTYVKINYNGQDAWVVNDLIRLAACPGVCVNTRWLTRQDWDARDPKSTTPMPDLPITTVIIHHSDTPTCTTEADCIARVQSIQNFHMDDNGWDDIGYNFLVGEDGQGYEGRGWQYVGAHAGEQCNYVTLGISLIGDFEDNRPNQAIMDAVLDIIDCGIQEGYIVPWEDLNIIGHQDACTNLCPGQYVTSIIQDWSWYGKDMNVCTC